MTQAILTIEDYAKTFHLHERNKDIPSASGVNLSVYPGRLTALIGPTGAGKSSVLKGIYRTYLPSSGSSGVNVQVCDTALGYTLNAKWAKIKAVGA